MYRYLSSIRHGRGSSFLSLPSPQPSSSRAPISRFVLGSQQNGIEYVRGFLTSDRPSFFMRDRLNENSRSELDSRPSFMRDRENINSRGGNDAETERSYSRPMDFVRGVIDEDRKDVFHAYAGTQLEKDADFVHIKMLRNNTFVTITDSKGNIKLSGSAGSLKEMKAGQKLSRYAAEATAEVVGRRARGLGLKAVVMKVNGFTHFRRKRQAIMSWLEGFNDSRGDRSRNPVVHLEDTTQKPHNGCRLPKKRRI